MDLLLCTTKPRVSIRNAKKPNLVTVVQADMGISRIHNAGRIECWLDLDRGLTVTVCAIMEDEETDLDYAIVNVFRNELSSTCDDNTRQCFQPHSRPTRSLKTAMPSSHLSSVTSGLTVISPSKQTDFSSESVGSVHHPRRAGLRHLLPESRC
jgi:hypothetical protein